MANKIRVLIAEDFDIIRQNFVKLIGSCADMEVVGAAASGRQCVELAQRVPADIILMDMEMENIHAGADAAQQLQALGVPADIVFLTIHETDDLIYSAFSAGAVDYVIKTEPPEAILEHLRNVYRGEPNLAPRIQNSIRAEFLRLKRSEQSLIYFVNSLSQLTPAEKALLRLLLEGHKVNEIARIRQVELVTVKTQIKSLLRKFNCRRSKDIVQMLRELGLDRLFISN